MVSWGEKKKKKDSLFLIDELLPKMLIVKYILAERYNVIILEFLT